MKSKDERIHWQRGAEVKRKTGLRKVCFFYKNEAMRVDGWGEKHSSLTTSGLTQSHTPSPALPHATVNEKHPSLL